VHRKLDKQQPYLILIGRILDKVFAPFGSHGEIGYSRGGQLPVRVSIDRRPAIVERRCRLGDWELDTVIGKGHKGALVSLCERKSRLTVIGKVSRKSAEEVGKAAVRLLRPLTSRVRTLTSDNGREFADHRSIARALGAKFYFAHPYSSWEPSLATNTDPTNPINPINPRLYLSRM